MQSQGISNESKPQQITFQDVAFRWVTDGTNAVRRKALILILGCTLNSTVAENLPRTQTAPAYGHKGSLVACSDQCPAVCRKALGCGSWRSRISMRQFVSDEQ